MEPTFKVPIRNLFCLLSYVHEIPEFIESLNDVDEDLITYDFIVNQFLKEVDYLHRRGLVKGYVETIETTNRLGGRLLVNESMPYIIGNKPAVVCEKDEYSANILPNQVMNSTLKAICTNRYVREETRQRSFMYLERTPEVDTPPLTKEVFIRVNFSRHNIHYKRMIHIAKILHELTLLSHKKGNWSLFSAELDETSLNQIFEKFLYNFYKLEQNKYNVASEKMNWNLKGNQSLLPTMQTDVSLTHKREPKKIVMDAKYYKNIFQHHYGKSSFHSQNMYQLYTYLMHQPQDMKLRGILVYPYNGMTVEETYHWDDRMTMEIMNVNLNDSWQDIYERLMDVVEY